MLSKIYKFIKNFINSHFWLILIFIVLISYGQILWMQPWEDDNALFVKLADLQSRVGYFGSGPLGEGVYKFAAVPFILIYKLFGYYIPAYFALLLILYIITTLVVYKVLSKIFGESGGRVAGFIYAAGYITSDSFWRMANSATTSISIILISLFILFYWKYYKKKNIKFYLLALFFFLVSIVYAVSRTHYLIAVVVFFELIFFAFKKMPKSIYSSIARIASFMFIFSQFVLSAGDSRTSGVSDYIISILNGKYYLTYGFFSSITNLIIPDQLTSYVFGLVPFARKLLLLLSTVLFYQIFKRHKSKKVLLSFFYITSLAWYFVAKNIYLVPILNIGEKQLFVVTLGGLSLLLFGAIFVYLKKNKWIYLFFVFWLLVNLAAYSSYFPTVAYDTVNRYLAHSFFALAGILGILYSSLSGKNKSRLFLRTAIVLFAVMNLFSAVLYQQKILQGRSYPVKSFYEQLSILLPKIEQGDVLYFDVSKNSQGHFRDAISAAMIPDTGSFGWRYGIYRYDFSLETDFESLYKKVTEEKIRIENIHAFLYSNNELIDISKNIQTYFSDKNYYIYPHTNLNRTSKAVINKVKDSTSWSQPELIADIKSPIKSYIPIECDVSLLSTPLETKNLLFPLYWGLADGKTKNLLNDPEQKKLALLYKKEMDDFIKYSSFNVSSVWADRVIKNLYDNDINTVWQSDRVLWQSKRDYIEVSLPIVKIINRIVWTPSSYQASVPINYEIEISLDGKNWKNIKSVTSKEVNNQTPQEISFMPILAKFVKMTITETFGGDSPMIAEFRILSDNLLALDLKSANYYLEKPFIFIDNEEIFKNTLSSFGLIGSAQVYYLSDKENNWNTTNELKLEILYDGRPHFYNISFPAGGTRIKNIKISNFSVPGTINLYNLGCKTN